MAFKGLNPLTNYMVSVNLAVKVKAGGIADPNALTERYR
jgi:hypothetical protein